MNDDELSRRTRAVAEAVYARIERGESSKPPTKQEALEKLESTRRMTEDFACAVFRSNARAIADGSWPEFQIVWWPLVRKYHKQLLEVSEGRLTQEKFRELVIGDAERERDRLQNSGRQARIAAMPRTDALQELIFEILGAKTKADVEFVWKELKKQRGNGVIDTVVGDKDDGYIEWTDRARGAKDTLASALKRRVSRAKKGR